MGFKNPCEFIAVTSGKEKNVLFPHSPFHIAIAILCQASFLFLFFQSCQIISGKNFNSMISKKEHLPGALERPWLLVKRGHLFSADCSIRGKKKKKKKHVEWKDFSASLLCSLRTALLTWSLNLRNPEQVYLTSQCKAIILCFLRLFPKKAGKSLLENFTNVLHKLSAGASHYLTHLIPREWCFLQGLSAVPSSREEDAVLVFHHGNLGQDCFV